LNALTSLTLITPGKRKRRRPLVTAGEAEVEGLVGAGEDSGAEAEGAEAARAKREKTTPTAGAGEEAEAEAEAGDVAAKAVNTDNRRKAILRGSPSTYTWLKSRKGAKNPRRR